MRRQFNGTLLQRKPSMIMRWLFAAALLLVSSQAATEAATWYVDITNPGCSNSGAGTQAQPYCTITAAQTAHKGAGVTLLVSPGRYREQVSVGASGAAGTPFVFQAAGPGVIVDGTDDMSSAALWQPYSGDVWVAPAATWLPRQVFVDGERLGASTLTTPADITPGTFLSLADGLYVNLGGDAPSSHLMEVGRRNFGFTASARTWIVIDGFEVMRTENRGIAINTSSDDCVVSNNTVTLNRFQGIVVNGAARALVENNTVADNADHGIYLIAGSTAAVVRGNESYGNARPGTRAANGIGLSAATGNTIENNRVHDNQDTGFQFSSGANGNLSRQNISWNNGDHGYDHVQSSGNVHIGDIAYGNTNDGFSQEGTAPGNTIVNCIGVNNGLLTGGNNLWVDSTSTAGFVSDYNIFWNETGQAPIRYVATTYPTIAAFTAATGLDAHSIQADPRFHDPVNGLFDLLPGSPAIDSAESSTAGWPALDARGAARMDDPYTTDTGNGPVAYADRGAIEYDPQNHPPSPPVAALAATPASGTAPLSVSFDASASLDYDGAIVSYTFDFGDGSPLEGPQAGAAASHVYGAGSFTATVTVIDSDGLEDTATAAISMNTPPVAALLVTPGSGKAQVAVLADASGSSDPDGSIVSYAFDFGDGATAGPQASPQASHTYGVGAWTATVTVTDDKGASRTAAAPMTVAANEPPVAALSVTPATVKIPGSVLADAWGSSDPDGRTVSYTFDFGDGTGVGPLAFGAVTHDYAVGVWTLTVTVRDENGDSASTSAQVTAALNQPPAASLNVTPSSGWAPLDVTADASGSTDSDGTVVLYRFDFGDGSPVVGPQMTPTATHSYAPGTWTATVTVTDDSGDSASTGTTVTALANTAPTASLVATPSSGKAPLPVTLDASGSTDAEGAIVSYLFQFGDGTVVGPQASSTASHTYAAGSWTASVTVTDTAGTSSTATEIVTVTANQAPNGVINTPSGNVSILVGQSVTFTGTGTDPDGDTPLTYRWTFGTAAPASTLEDPGAVTFGKVGTYTITFTVTDARGLADPTPASVTVSVRKK